MTPTASGAKRAIGYVRLQPGAAEPQCQREEAERVFASYCARSGYDLRATFVETDGAGAGVGSAFRDLVRLLQTQGGACTVIVPSTETLGRKRDEAAIVVLELEDLGARAQLLNGAPLDPVRMVTAPWPKAGGTADVSERIKTAMRSRAIRGEGLGKPPYGYHIGKSKKLEIHSEESEVVRKIFVLYTQKNKGIRLIVRELNEQKIPTRKGRNWSMVTIRDILRNRAYLGTYTRFGMRVPGSHPAIITPDMFRWAQSRLDARKPQRKNGQAEPFLLSGLIYCGYCGNRMVGVTRRQSWTRRRDGSRAEKQYRYYQCQSRTNQSVCGYHTRRACDLEATVVDYLKAHRDQVASARTPNGEASRSTAKEREKLLTSRRGIDRRLRQALQQAAMGSLSQQRLRTQAAQLLRSRRDLDDRLAGLDRLAPMSGEVRSAGEDAAAAIDRLAANGDLTGLAAKRTLFQELIAAVTVYDDRVDIKLRIG